MEDKNQKVLDINELAVYLHCSTQTIRKMIRNKEIPYFNIGRKMYISKETIDIWIRNQEMKNLQREENEEVVKNIGE